MDRQIDGQTDRWTDRLTLSILAWQLLYVFEPINKSFNYLILGMPGAISMYGDALPTRLNPEVPYNYLILIAQGVGDLGVLLPPPLPSPQG